MILDKIMMNGWRIFISILTHFETIKPRPFRSLIAPQGSIKFDRNTNLKTAEVKKIFAKSIN